MDANVFGLRLKNIREEKLMTQQELADKLGVIRQNVSNYEKGRNLPSLELAGKIADIFDVTIDYLMGRTERRDYVLVGPAKLPGELVDRGLDAVSLSKTLLDDDGNIIPEAVQELFRLVAEAKAIRDREKN